eukprot:evm.model.scf_1105.1 EVM.evm.TU.scf_1105.1   scf_1105:4011-6956(-)
MDESRVKFGLRDCATDDEGSSGGGSDQEFDFSDSDSDLGEEQQAAGDSATGRGDAAADLREAKGHDGARAGGRDRGGQVKKSAPTEGAGGDDTGGEGEGEGSVLQPVQDNAEGGGGGRGRRGGRGGRGGRGPARRRPFDVPRTGEFYLHDDRWVVKGPVRTRDVKDGENEGGEQHWKHDKFEELEKQWKGAGKAPQRATGDDASGEDGGLVDMADGPRRGGRSRDHSRSSDAGSAADEGLPKGVSRSNLKIGRGGRRLSAIRKKTASLQSAGEGRVIVKPKGTLAVAAEPEGEAASKETPGKVGSKARVAVASVKPAATVKSAQKRGPPRADPGSHDEKPRKGAPGRNLHPVAHTAAHKDGEANEARGQLGAGNRADNRRVYQVKGQGGHGTAGATPGMGHRRRASTGQGSLVPESQSPKHRLNPFATPFKAMNPNAVPFVPQGFACAQGAGVHPAHASRRHSSDCLPWWKTG